MRRSEKCWPGAYDLARKFSIYPVDNLVPGLVPIRYFLLGKRAEGKSHFTM
jgi:hypothetical protein